MKTALLISAGIAVGLFIYFVFIRKKKGSPVEPPVTKARVLELLFPPPIELQVGGPQFRLHWQVIELPSRTPLLNQIVNWRVERDSRAPAGGPDVPCLDVGNGVLTAIAPGTREVYAAFSDTPEEKAIRFVVRVVCNSSRRWRFHRWHRNEGLDEVWLVVNRGERQMLILIFCAAVVLLQALNLIVGLMVLVVLSHKQRGKPQGEVKIMFKVQNNHPPIPYEIEIGKVTDSEGEEITNPDVLAGINVSISSTDPSAVQVNQLDGPKKGELVIGHSGQASVNCEVRDGQGNLLAVAEPANFVVTTGDPSKIDTLKFRLEGVEEEPAAVEGGGSPAGAGEAGGAAESGLGGTAVGDTTNESGGGVAGSTASEGGSTETKGGFETGGGFETKA